MYKPSFAKKLLWVLVCAALILPLCACGKQPAETTEGPDTTKEPGTGEPETTKEPETMPVTEDTDPHSRLWVNVTQDVATRADKGGKDDLTVILVIGQSNFTSTVGAPNERTGVIQGLDIAVSAEPTLPPVGTCYSGKVVRSLDNWSDVTTLVNSGEMGGICPSFGAKWNELTGNKVVFVQAAEGAVGMHEWVPNPEDYFCTCNSNGKGVLYKNAVANFKATVEALKTQYNIVTTGYIWNQGEHEEVYAVQGNSICDSDSYYEAFKLMHESLMDDLDLDFGGVVIVRNDKCSRLGIRDAAAGSMSLDVARVAQYRAINTLDDLYLISRIPETCDVSMMTMYNGGGIHYNQKTFNAMGADAAENLFKAAGFGDNAQFTGISVYDAFGKKLVSYDLLGRVVDGDPLIPYTSDTLQLLAVIEPLGTTCTLSLSSDLDNWDRNGFVNWSVVTPDEGTNAKYLKVKLNYLSVQ